ncbi:unnamed protein product [Orchesella dallaii]|uniref:Odorant receptor n=1 Tax=Orchesella dallaii TaxID=48710 RepID=A0ABP1S1K6_9HEXA
MSEKFTATPIQWNEQKKMFYTSKKLKYEYRITFIFQFIQILSIGINLLKSRYVDKAQYGEQAFLFIIFTGSTYMLIISVPFITDPDLLVDVQNACFQYCEFYKETFIPDLNTETHPRNRIWDGLLITFFFLTMSLGFFVFVHFIFYPEFPMYPYYLIPPSTSFTVKAILYVVNGMFLIRYAIALLLMCCMLMAFLLTIFIFHYVQCKEFRFGTFHHETLETLRRYDVLPCRYRTAQLLLKSYLEVFALWFGIISWGGSCFRISTAAVNSWISCHSHWDSPEDIKFMMKFRRSCKPMTINYMGYVMKSLTSLKFLQGLVRGTFRTVLTLR